MKKVISSILFFGLLFSISFAQQDASINWARISEDLEVKMKETPDDEYIEVSIIMYDQVDLIPMMDYFRLERVPLERRAKQVITSLQAKAEATQPAFVNYLKTVDGVNKSSIKRLWITNEMRASINKDAIATLSWRGEIDYLHVEPILYEVGGSPTEIIEESAFSPNGREPAHDLMNVPALWELGYTGTNRKVFVIDEGADLEHPGLNRNYRGFQDGNSVSFFDVFGGVSDTVPARCEAQDINDHGTWVIGCAVGYDFSRRDTIGAAPNALWMSSPLQAGNPDDPDPSQRPNCIDATTDATVGLQWALDPDGDPNTIDDMPDVINLSFGFPPGTCSNNFQNRLNALEAAGVAVIAAAGNAGPNSMTVGAPASGAVSLVNPFSVGAIDLNEDISGFSSRGPTTCTSDSGSLAIKPEVVAPGEGIRTTANRNRFATIQGTSFSSPYACGVFLLLKEAFPSLSGEEIKLALYLTAKDLGVVGEDNFYGMGLLDALAAYNYLVSEGNTPEPRNPDADGLVYNLNDLSAFSCAQDVAPTFTIENSGTSTMTAATINYEYSNGINGTINWTGSLAKNRSERVVIPVQSLPTGDYSLKIELVQVNSKTEFSIRDNVIEQSFSIFDDVIPTVTSTNPEACAGGSAVIEANTGGSDREVVWYDAATGGEVVGIGSPFITPEITSNTTYYAEAMRVEKVGLPDINAGQSFASISDDSYLTFDVLNDLEIRSIKVFASSAGIRRIAIVDADGNTVARSSFFNLDVGENKVDLNFSVPRGNNYRMEQVGQVDELFATVNNFSFPFELPGIISITGSNDGLYNFFYDWEIISSFNCERVAQAVTVSTNTADAAFTPSRTVLNLANSGRVNFNNTSTGALSYEWDFGDGTTSTDQNPSHDYTLAGTYTVTLVVSGSGGCTDVATAQIVASGIVGIAEDLAELGEVKVYPNPSVGNFFLDMDFKKREEVEIEIFDLPGRRVWSSESKSYVKDKVEMDLSQANKGVYLLKVSIGNLTWVQKLIKE
ncbi:MAG: S8 family serine peptidase [Bacteroidota bacterium]